MTQVILRPNATTSNTGTLTGGASANAVLSDNSDGSYVTLNNFADGFVVGCTDLTLPAGAVIKTVTIRARTARTTTTTEISCDWPHAAPVLVGQPLITWAVPTTITAGSISTAGISDATVDAGEIGCVLTASNPIRIYEVYLDVTYVEKPVINSITVEGVASGGTVGTTNMPTIEWTWS